MCGNLVAGLNEMPRHENSRVGAGGIALLNLVLDGGERLGSGPRRFIPGEISHGNRWMGRFY